MSAQFGGLKQVFNIADTEETQQYHVSTVPEKVIDTADINEDVDQLEDYKETREVLKRILFKTESALDDMLQFARGSEKGRDFEVVGQLAKTLSDVSNNLLDVHKRMADIRKKQDKEQKSGAPTTIEQQNNVVFTGSPSDLIEALKNKK